MALCPRDAWLGRGGRGFLSGRKKKTIVVSFAHVSRSNIHFFAFFPTLDLSRGKTLKFGQ